MASSGGRVPSSNARSGYTPNVYWRSPTFQELRRLPGYRALPPPGFVELRCEACAPFFRQDSDEWAALHSGRVTTSALPGVLGMKERITSLKLKLPKGYASHHHALKAFDLLREPSFATPEAEKGGGRREALQFNASQVEAYNDELARLVAEDSDCFDEEDEAERQARWRRSKQAGKSGAMSVHCSFGLAQEPAALFSLMAAVGMGECLEVGLCPLAKESIPREWKVDKGNLPPLGASPDGLLTIPLSDLGRAEEGSLARRIAEAVGGDGAAGSDRWGKDGNLCCVVEIKSVSPFREVVKRTKSGKRKKRRYKLIDAEPRDGVQVLHVPQLQMHMLCTGAPAALYMSFSAGHGMAIYVVKADKFYQRCMLRWVARFVKEFVKRDVQPPHDFWHDLAPYQAFLGHTRSIARKARMVDLVPPTVMAKHKDSAPFLKQDVL